MKTVLYFPILLVAAVGVLTGSALLFGCAGVPSSTECTDIAETAGNAFSGATPAGTTWLYQLQNAGPEEIAEADYDILVIDYSRDGEESGRYSAEEMGRMKSRSSGPPRTVLAYLSIGEAEDYRYYFDSSWTAGIGSQPSAEAPCWLGRTNPEWEGNYKVQYWSEDWQRIILGYLDTIIDDGFDGVYLDIIDAYEYWADEENGESFFIPKDEAAAGMINFVKRIAYHARTVRGVQSFFILPQNGEDILDYDTGLPGPGNGDYLATISGIGIEDLYYWETDGIDTAETARRKNYLNIISAAGKKVLVVDYVDDGSESGENTERINDFTSSAESDGYLPFAATVDRELASIP